MKHYFINMMLHTVMLWYSIHERYIKAELRQDKGERCHSCNDIKRQERRVGHEEVGVKLWRVKVATFLLALFLCLF